MTTITIEQSLLEQALNALLLPCDRWNKQQFLIVKGAIESLNAALAAPATAPAWHDAPTVPGLWVVKTIVGPEAHNIEPHDINVGGNRQSGGGTPEDCPVDRQVGGG